MGNMLGTLVGISVCLWLTSAWEQYLHVPVTISNAVVQDIM